MGKTKEKKIMKKIEKVEKAINIVIVILETVVLLIEARKLLHISSQKKKAQRMQPKDYCERDWEHY